MMDAERLNQVEELFHEARGREAAERGAFLDGACRGDLELRAEVESLLAHGTDAPAPLRTADTRSRLEQRGPLQEGPGSLIGAYKLLQLLGEGGFGAVYMAEQREPVRRRVALKIIKLGMDTKQVIARFEAERQALALMDHPNIAKVLDAGATQTGRPYFVMELVRGVPITEYCDKAGMSTEERLKLFVSVCRAVQHAHQKGIVHRDIKPSNVLVTLHDGEPVPKVIDFGIAKATNQELTEKTVFTEFRQFIGTPEYMSPEQAEMSGLDIDTRADVYSLGVLLYELLTGTTPVDPQRLRSAGYQEMQRILREEEPVRPSTRLSTMGAEAAVVARKRRDDPEHLSRSLRGDLDWILLKALEKDRSRRYETASAFALDVERHLQDEMVVASPPSRVYKLRKFLRRNRRAVAAGIALFVTLLLGIAGTTAGFVQARRALAGEQQARSAAEQSAAAALEEAARQRALAGFFEDTLTSTGPWDFGSEAPARVVDLLDLAASRLAVAELAEQPVAKAVLARSIGIAYLERDRWEEALEHLRLAIEWLGDAGADPLTWSGAARELDRIDTEPYFELDVGVDVESLRDSALAGLEPLLEEGSAEAVAELFQWTQVFFKRGLFAEAAAHLRRMLEIVRARQDLAGRYAAVMEFNLACAEARLGNEEEARRRYGIAAEEMRGIVRRGDAEAADEWLGCCQHPALGLFMATAPPIAELIELAGSRYVARNLGMADYLRSIAWIQEDIGHPKEGYEAMREAVDIARGFPNNRLMLGAALVDLAYFEWMRGRTDEVLELCSEARPLLAATQARPRRRASFLIIACLVEQVVADVDAPETADRVRRIEQLAEEASRRLDRVQKMGSRLPWYRICRSMVVMHRALAGAGETGDHARLAREWNDRLRRDLEPRMDIVLPDNDHVKFLGLANLILLLEDATRQELERARDLAARADEIAGGILAQPVDALARALFRLGDLEGAVRQARRAMELAATHEPVRGLEARLERYEAALAGGR